MSQEQVCTHSVDSLTKMALKPQQILTQLPNKKTGGHQSTDNNLFFIHNLARLAGIEPATYGFVARTLEFSNLLT